MKNAIIFDIDGTLADLTHRRHFVTGSGKPDWNSFMAKMVDDPPLHDTCWLANLLGDHPLVNSDKVSLFLFSGRPETHREDTEAWLSSNVSKYFMECTDFLMRAEGDSRSDNLVKLDMLESVRLRGYNVRIAVDDRPSVVKMWRDAGVTCLAMDASGFDAPKTWDTGSLHMMIGPSCAGKSSALQSAYFDQGDIHIISSDDLREEITGGVVYGAEYFDMNDQVYSYMAAALKARIDHGLTTIIDACNIHSRRRRPLLDSCPKDATIWYHVYDRPLHIKQKDAGLRDKMFMPDGLKLIESHHRSFKGALPTILAGDHDPRVTVIDHRRKT